MGLKIECSKCGNPHNKWNNEKICMACSSYLATTQETCRFYRKGDFLYAELGDIFLEVNMEFLSSGRVAFVMMHQQLVNIDWRSHAKEINRDTFRRYYNQARKLNLHMPLL